MECLLISKVDLVMWTKNGAKTLDPVLKRINQVIPPEFVNKRIMVDDQSTDATRRIAVASGWTVVPNEGTGISDGANTALMHVETEHFVSFEQDLLLAEDWWEKIPPLLQNPQVAAASGMRFASQPRGVQKLQLYVAKKYRGEANLASWLRNRRDAAFTLGSTLDNTIYKTSVVRSVGGFPKVKVNAGVDTTLAYPLRGVLEKTGLFDSDIFMYFDEVDLCWRIWLAGYRVLLAPASLVLHASGSTASRLQEKTRLYFSIRNHLLVLLKKTTDYETWLGLVWFLSFLNSATCRFSRPVGY